MSCYSYAQIPALIALFEAVKPYIWDGRNEESDDVEHFICHAIERIDVDEDMRRTACALIHMAIDSECNGSTLESYLFHTQFEIVANWDQWQFQATRQLWLDQIITDLKAFYVGDDR